MERKFLRETLVEDAQITGKVGRYMARNVELK